MRLVWGRAGFESPRRSALRIRLESRRLHLVDRLHDLFHARTLTRRRHGALSDALSDADERPRQLFLDRRDESGLKRVKLQRIGTRMW